MPSKFTENKVFADSRVNSLLDRMRYEIEKALPELEEDLSNFFGLTGRAASILQGAVNKECSNVIFIVDNGELYAFLREQLGKKMKATGVVKLEGRTLIYFPEAFIEIWEWDGEDPLNIEKHDGIEVQALAQINEILL